MDMTGKKCKKCKKGKYTETSIHDDIDGVLHCDKCGHEVKRHTDDMKEQYIEQANNLMERLLGEAPEDEVEDTPPTDAPEGEEGAEEIEDTGETEEKGQAEQVEIFFDNLDEDSQKVLIDALKESLNVAEDDKFAHQKLVDALSAKPLVTFRADELVRKLNLDI